MKTFKYDVIQLIHSVRDRPCLWDKTIENYKDRTERKAAWKEIFCILEESYEDMTSEEKRFTEEAILNKWTNVRDTFIKTLKTRMGRPKKKYLLYNHIKFLTKIVPVNERHGVYNNEESDVIVMKEEVETESESNSPVDEPSYSKKRSKRNDFDEEKSASDYSASEVSFSSPKRKSKRLTRGNDSKEVTKKKTRKVNGKDDSEIVSLDNDTNDIDFVEIADNDPRIMNEDEAFFASLLPSVVKYTEDERLEFRIEVLGVMKRIKDKREWVIG